MKTQTPFAHLTKYRAVYSKTTFELRTTKRLPQQLTVQIRLVWEYCCSAGVLPSTVSKGQQWETFLKFSSEMKLNFKSSRRAQTSVKQNISPTHWPSFINVA